jgi:hypothetical protein
MKMKIHRAFETSMKHDAEIYEARMYFAKAENRPDEIKECGEKIARLEASVPLLHSRQPLTAVRFRRIGRSLRRAMKMTEAELLNAEMLAFRPDPLDYIPKYL